MQAKAASTDEDAMDDPSPRSNYYNRRLAHWPKMAPSRHLRHLLLHLISTRECQAMSSKILFLSRKRASPRLSVLALTAAGPVPELYHQGACAGLAPKSSTNIASRRHAIDAPEQALSAQAAVVQA